MKPFEIALSVVNIVAVALSPIIAVVVGQALQTRAEKRKDKMQIFQCLMTRRITGWAAWESVNALNLIDMVFSDNKAIREQWKLLLSKLRNEISSQEQQREQCKLLELMANDLGYKGKITWENIQNPYYPVGLDQQFAINSQITNGQVDWAKLSSLILNTFNTSTDPTKTGQEEPPNAHT